MKSLLTLLALLTFTSTGLAYPPLAVTPSDTVLAQVEAEAETDPVVPQTSDENAEDANTGAAKSTASIITQEDCPEGYVCVEVEDMTKILKVLRERKCLMETEPTFEVSDVKIVIDRDNRVFYTGSGPESPYTIEMKWCPFTVTAEGKVDMTVGLMEPPVWGFRFRPKAYLGYLPMTPFFDGNDFSDGIDAGFMVDFVHYKWLNLNVALGFRSVGIGLGADITKNFGGYVGYGLAWKPLFQPSSLAPPHNLVVGLDFAF